MFFPKVLNSVLLMILYFTEYFLLLGGGSFKEFFIGFSPTVSHRALLLHKQTHTHAKALCQIIIYFAYRYLLTYLWSNGAKQSVLKVFNPGR